MNFYISNLSHCIGDLKKINDFSIKKEINIDYLNNLGIERYSESQLNPFKLAELSIVKTLANYKNPIDLVIYCSCSLDDHESIKNDFSELLYNLGIPEINSIGMFISRCSNFTMVVNQAMNIIKSELDTSSILVIISDKIYAEKDRINEANYICSDAASSFIVSKFKSEPSYEVLNINEYADNAIALMSPTKSLVNYLKAVEEGIKTISTTNMKKLGLRPEAYKKFICGSYNSTIMLNYAKMSGFSRDTVFSNNLKKYGHTFSSNFVIALEETIAENENEELFFILTTGDFIFGAITLKLIK